MTRSKIRLDKHQFGLRIESEPLCSREALRRCGEERAQRRNGAILAADVVGYSRTLEQDEVGTPATLKRRCKGLLGLVVVRYQGITGDDVLLGCLEAFDDVQCAVDVQRSMAGAIGHPPKDRRIMLRISDRHILAEQLLQNEAREALVKAARAPRSGFDALSLTSYWLDACGHVSSTMIVLPNE